MSPCASPPVWYLLWYLLMGLRVNVSAKLQTLALQPELQVWMIHHWIWWSRPGRARDLLQQGHSVERGLDGYSSLVSKDLGTTQTTQETAHVRTMKVHAAAPRAFDTSYLRSLWHQMQRLWRAALGEWSSRSMHSSHHYHPRSQARSESPGRADTGECVAASQDETLAATTAHGSMAGFLVLPRPTPLTGPGEHGHSILSMAILPPPPRASWSTQGLMASFCKSRE